MTDNNATSTTTSSVLQSLPAAELICQLLSNYNITHIFGGHGGAIVPLVDAIESHPNLTFVLNRCEVNASQAAMAYAKLHNRLGCCIATSGPGAAHLLSGLVDADQDRVPMICITGLKDVGSVRHADFQDVDQASIFRMAGLAISETVSHISQLIPLLRNALYTAISNNRCVHLAIPVDIQGQLVTVPKLLNFRPENVSRKVLERAGEEEIGGLATAILKERMKSQHMVIFCGWRAAAEGLGNAIEDVAEFLDVPVITSFDGKGVVGEGNGFSFGVAGIYGFVGGGKSQSVLENCDVVIAICLPDMSKALSDKKDMQVRKLIQIETDLMKGDTSRYIARHTFESNDLAVSLPKVLQAMKTEKEVMKLDFQGGLTKPQYGGGYENDEKINSHGCMSKARMNLHPSNHDPKNAVKALDVMDSKKFCYPETFFEIMSRHLDEDSILCADIGDNALYMASGVIAKKGQRTLTSEHMGIMGFGLNSALAASLSSSATPITNCATATSANGSCGRMRKVLAVAGDGGIQMSLNEIATMKDHGSQNVLVVIVVNKRLGRVNNETWGPGLRADGCNLGSPDYIKLFEAYGYPNGQVLSTSDEIVIEETIRKGWELAESQGVAVVVVQQDPKVFPTMHKITPASGHVAWEHYLKEMNKERNVGFKSSGRISSPSFGQIPGFHFSQDTTSKLDSLQDWIEGFETTQTSSYTWIGESFLSISPAAVFQHQLTEMNPNAPDVFATQEEKDNFDKDFWAVVMKGFSISELNEIIEKGTSNGYPLRFQILILPKDAIFKLHAHPNVEVSIGMQGTLYHYYLTDYTFPKHELERFFPPGSPYPTDETIKDLMDEFETCMVIDDRGDRSRFVEDVYASRGQVGINPAGSVHQSFSSKEGGAMLFVLWSGCHCNIKLSNVKHKLGTELLREV